MFSYLNAVIDLQKKSVDSMLDAMPDSQFKTATVGFHKVNTEFAFKSIEMADGYVDSLRKLFSK